MSTDMSQRKNRLKTFKSKWSHNSITPKEMSKRGFFLIGNYEVKCFYCDKAFVNNKNLNDIFIKHDMYSPECKMTCKIEVDRAMSNFSSSLEITEKPLKISVPDGGPHYPEYKSYKARLKTYEEWPKYMKQTPEELSKAGFFYTLKSDKVQCYSCSGGLRNWEIEDDPWEQHIIWYRYCDHVCKNKTIEEIENVLIKRFGIQPTDPINPETDQNNLANIDIAEGPPRKTNDEIFNLRVTSVEKAMEKLFMESGFKHECKICKSDEINTIFFPCAHIVACAACSKLNKHCTICKRKIKQIKKVYFG